MTKNNRLRDGHKERHGQLTACTERHSILVRFYSEQGIFWGKMRHTGLRIIAYRAAFFVGWTSGVLAGLAGGINGLQKLHFSPGLSSIWSWVEFAQSYSWLVTLLGSTIAGGCAVYIKISGKPWVWEIINAQLDEFRDHVYKEQSGEERHRHQVTLFRRCKCCSPCTYNLLRRVSRRTTEPLLIPVERSGNMNQKTSTSFVISETTSKFEGVAGRAWAKGNNHLADNLPEITDSSGEAEIQVYANKADVTVDWVRDRLKSKKSLARSLYGIPIRVAGEPWGVIMLDSDNPDGIKQRTVVSAYNQIGTTLCRLLERV